MNINNTKLRRLLGHVAVSQWERNFVKSLMKQKFRYTEKQEDIVERLWKEYYPEPMDEIELEALTEFKEQIYKKLLAHEIKLIELDEYELPF